MLKGFQNLDLLYFAIDFTNEGPGVDAQIDRQTMIDDYRKCYSFGQEPMHLPMEAWQKGCGFWNFLLVVIWP
jgi:hypothetical protein